MRRKAEESPPAGSEAAVADKPSARAVQKRIAQDAEALYEGIQAFFADALSADRQVWASCPNCRKRHEVDVPDWHARAKVLELLLNQGYGRPKAGKYVDGQWVSPERRDPVRSDARYCSNACKQAAYRARKAAIRRLGPGS